MCLVHILHLRYKSSVNDQDAEFANALNCMGETSKFDASIGSCDLSMKHSTFLFNSKNESITTTWDNFENSLKGVLDPSQIEFFRHRLMQLKQANQ